MKKVFIEVILILFMMLVLASSATGAEDKEAVLTFGEVFPHTDEAKSFTLPVVEYVVDHLNLPGIVRADAVITDNIDEMITHIKEKRVDIFVDTLHPVVYMKNRGVELKPILYRLKKNIKDAEGVFIARKDNDSINTLSDLVGKKLVFKTVHATQAHLVPRAYLLKKGYKLNYSISDDPEAINCSFVADYFDIEDLVLSGLADAGATSSHRLDLLVRVEKEKLKIIDQTPRYPFHLVSVAPHVSSEISEKIKKVLLHMGQDPAAKQILARYYRTTGFEIVPPNVSEIIKELEVFCDPVLHKNNGLSFIDLGKGTLVIGRVSDNPQKHYKRLKPLVDYAVSHMKDLGIIRGEVLFANNNQEMIEYLKEGRVDWVTETIFSALIFCKETGAEIMAKRWKGGSADYHTIFFTRNDSQIKSIKNLKGKKIAFEDPGSTTSYFIPIIEIQKAGLKPVELNGPRVKPPAEKVGYVFAGRDINVTTWVFKGLADAGAYSNQDWENKDDCPEAFKRNLKIIHRTKPFPRAVEIIRKDVNPEVKKRLKAILLDAHTDPNAKNALKAYRNTTRFDGLTKETKDSLEEAKNLLGNIH